MSEHVKCIQCQTVGISGITDIHIQKVGDNYEARVGIAILGECLDEDSKDRSPFDPNFHDNYANGTGKTEEEALENLKKDIFKTQEGLFW